MGATVSLTASAELERRVRHVVAFNPYDYPQGVGRANRVASIYIGSARLPAIGPVVTRMETKPMLGTVLRGGLLDGSKLPDHYLGELRRVGRRRGYPRVAREVYRNVDSMISARPLYGRVSAPLTLVYGDHDWSRVPERDANSLSCQAPDRSRSPTPGTSLRWNSPTASPRSCSTTPAPERIAAVVLPERGRIASARGRRGEPDLCTLHRGRLYSSAGRNLLRSHPTWRAKLASGEGIGETPRILSDFSSCPRPEGNVRAEISRRERERKKN